MKNVKVNQKVVLAGLLMTLLSFNVSWHEFMGFNFGSSDDFASKGVALSTTDKQKIGEKAVAACADPNKGFYEEARILFESGSYSTPLEYEHKYDEDGEEQVEHVTYSSTASLSQKNLAVCPSGRPYEVQSNGYSSNRNCRKDEIVKDRMIPVYQISVNLSQGTLYDTEAQHNSYCENCVKLIKDLGTTADNIQPVQFTVTGLNNQGDPKDQGDIVMELCQKYHKFKSIQYYEATNTLLAKAKDEAAAKELNKKLKELENKCIVKKDTTAEDVWEAVGKSHDENLTKVTALSDIDLLTGDSDDLSELAEAIVRTDKNEILRCHRNVVKNKDSKEAKSKHVHELLSSLREMAVSEDDDIREMATNNIEWLQDKRYGLNRNMKRFLKNENLRIEAGQTYRRRVADAEEYFQTRIDAANERGDYLTADIERENMEIALLNEKDQYLRKVGGTFSGWPKNDKYVKASADFWEDHIDGISTGGSVFDGSSIADRDFRYDRDTYVTNRAAREGRWTTGGDFSRYNSEAMRRRMNETLDTFRRQVGDFNSNSRFSGLSTSGRVSPPSAFLDAERRGSLIGDRRNADLRRGNNRNRSYRDYRDRDRDYRSNPNRRRFL